MGIAYAAMIAYAIFSAASGSSIAACATMAKIVAPEFERAGYNKRLAFGVITAGATRPPRPLHPPMSLDIKIAFFGGESNPQSAHRGHHARAYSGRDLHAAHLYY